jgi:hypothetical protein
MVVRVHRRKIQSANRKVEARKRVWLKSFLEARLTKKGLNQVVKIKRDPRVAATIGLSANREPINSAIPTT